jgi:hypothetical protein
MPTRNSNSNLIQRIQERKQQTLAHKGTLNKSKRISLKERKKLLTQRISENQEINTNPIVNLNSPMIPKIIHLYWHTKELPEFIKQCKQTMVRMNPDWVIKQYSHEDILKMKGYPAFCTRTYQLPYSQKDAIKYACDWLRLYVLFHEGGVYMDMSCVCLAPLESFLDMNSSNIQGFNMSFIPNFYCMENWFICSPPRHEFIKKWMKETEEAHRIPYGAELKYTEENYQYDGSKLQKFLPYLVQALAWKKLNIVFPEVKHTMIMGCTDKNGPYFWTNFKGSKQEQIRKMLMMKESEFKNIPFLKFNEGIRNMMVDAVQNPKFKQSFLVQYLFQ